VDDTAMLLFSHPAKSCMVINGQVFTGGVHSIKHILFLLKTTLAHLMQIFHLQWLPLMALPNAIEIIAHMGQVQMWYYKH